MTPTSSARQSTAQLDSLHFHRDLEGYSFGDDYVLLLLAEHVSTGEASTATVVTPRTTVRHKRRAHRDAEQEEEADRQDDRDDDDDDEEEGPSDGDASDATRFAEARRAKEGDGDEEEEQEDKATKKPDEDEQDPPQDVPQVQPKAKDTRPPVDFDAPPEGSFNYSILGSKSFPTVDPNHRKVDRYKEYHKLKDMGYSDFEVKKALTLQSDDFDHAVDYLASMTNEKRLIVPCLGKRMCFKVELKKMCDKLKSGEPLDMREKLIEDEERRANQRAGRAEEDKDKKPPPPDPTALALGVDSRIPPPRPVLRVVDGDRSQPNNPAALAATTAQRQRSGDTRTDPAIAHQDEVLLTPQQRQAREREAQQVAATDAQRSIDAERDPRKRELMNKALRGFRNHRFRRLPGFLGKALSAVKGFVGKLFSKLTKKKSESSTMVRLSPQDLPDPNEDPELYAREVAVMRDDFVREMRRRIRCNNKRWQGPPGWRLSRLFAQEQEVKKLLVERKPGDADPWPARAAGGNLEMWPPIVPRKTHKEYPPGLDEHSQAAQAAAKVVDDWVEPVVPEGKALRELAMGFDNTPFPYPGWSPPLDKKDPKKAGASTATVATTEAPPANTEPKKE